MMNLLANSIKFSPSGGTIQIKSKLITSEDDLTVKDPLFREAIIKSNAATFLEVQVQDPGIGITIED